MVEKCNFDTFGPGRFDWVRNAVQARGKNVYSQSPIQLTPECKHSIKSVELRQLAKNSSIALIPVVNILSGGLSVVAAAALNGGITLDDELNANRIAETSEMQQYQKNKKHYNNGDQFNSDAITGSVNIVNAPVQTTIE